MAVIEDSGTRRGEGKIRLCPLPQPRDMACREGTCVRPGIDDHKAILQWTQGQWSIQ